MSFGGSDVLEILRCENEISRRARVSARENWLHSRCCWATAHALPGMVLPCVYSTLPDHLKRAGCDARGGIFQERLGDVDALRPLRRYMGIGTGGVAKL